MILTDPVNDFPIPQQWLERVTLPLEVLVDGVNKGLLVVLSNGNILHRGYTTGTTAAAAAKASVLSLKGDVGSISVPTPCGVRAELTVKAKDGRCEVVKISGDHESDVTGGLVITAEARTSNSIQLSAGKGIGIVTRGGLQVKEGEPAINPVPRCQIIDAIHEALDECGLEGAAVTISVPDGEAVAALTLNPKVGIEGGISILGTSGFVEPWSDHLGETKMELISEASRVVLTTGRIGMRYSQMLFPEYTSVMVGSRLDEGIQAARGETIICGLPGLILKWAVPDILKGTGFNTVQEMIDEDNNWENPLIDASLAAVVEKSNGARIVIVDRDGNIIRDTGEMA